MQYRSSGFGFLNVFIFELYHGYTLEEFNSGKASSLQVTNAPALHGS